MRTEGQDPADSIAASYMVDMADQVDRLEDVVRERLAHLKKQNPAMDLDEKQPKKWYKAMKAFINEPAMVREMADRLTAKMQARFDIDEITRRGFNLYKNVARDIYTKELHALPEGQSEQHDSTNGDRAVSECHDIPVAADQPCDA